MQCLTDTLRVNADAAKVVRGMQMLSRFLSVRLRLPKANLD